MKVAYITMAFPAPSETFACNDVRELRGLGVSVVVHSLKSAHPQASQLAQERDLSDLPMTHGDPRAIWRGLGFVVQRPKCLLKLLSFIFRVLWKRPEHLVKSLSLVPRTLDIFRMILRDRPDVVHLFWGHYPSLLGFLVKQELPSTILSVFLGAYDLRMRYDASAAIVRWADVVWTHAQVNLPALERLGVPRERVQVVYRGIDTKRFEDLDLTTTEIPKRIVSAGRLIPEKGFRDVLHTFEKVYRQYPEASLVILGDGPQRLQLEQLADTLGISDAVQFLGHVSHKAVLEHMKQAEVFLFMSHSERLPNVVKEAMLCRCLCVATDTPGIEELIAHGEQGYIVAQGDVHSAASYINDTFAGLIDVEALKDKASRYVRETFDVGRSMAVYRDVWHRLVRQKAGQPAADFRGSVVHPDAPLDRLNR